MKNPHHCREERHDVVVVGGGLAGVCAAIAAARQGARTALVQARSVYGGNGSSEIRMHVVGAGCHMAKSGLAETGILMELLLENKRRNPYHAFPVWDSVLWEKVRFQENLTGYLNTAASGVVMEGGRIEAVLCYQYTTETAYRFSAAVFVDATGHGTVGTLAGAETRMGSESRREFGEPTAPEEADRHTMGNTLMFQAVDRGEPVRFVKPSWAYGFSEEDLKHRPHVNLTTSLGEGDRKSLPEFSRMDAGYWWIELGGDRDDIIAEGEDVRDDLLKCVYGVWDHIKNRGDHGADNYDLDWVGLTPGYRESRRLVGDCLLTENDIRANREFEDAVAYGGWPMDGHVPGGLLDFHNQPSKVYNFDGVYTIPYRCYYSRNVPNLMMAGRDISATKMAFGSTRVMGTCAVGGQAAGTAAALAVRHGCTPRELGQRHIGELQQALLRDDCWIPGLRNADPLDLARRASARATGSASGCGPEQVLTGITRAVGAESHCWESGPLAAGGQSLSLTLDRPAILREIRIVFDPNLTREIMPSINAQVKQRQTRYMPEELVRDYAVTLLRKGREVFSAKVADNAQRLNVMPLPAGTEADEARVTVLATHGHPAARIFEIRLY